MEKVEVILLPAIQIVRSEAIRFVKPDLISSWEKSLGPLVGRGKWKREWSPL